MTALIAGIAGAWSPCGFSMVDTIGTALGDARRGVTAAATRDVRARRARRRRRHVRRPRAARRGCSAAARRSCATRLAGAIALAAAFADWRGWRIAPQIRRQVPERWRWIMPLPLASSLYGRAARARLHDVRARASPSGRSRGSASRPASPALGIAVGLAFGARARAAGAVDRAAAGHAGAATARSSGSRSSRGCGSACAASTRSASAPAPRCWRARARAAAPIPGRDRPLGRTARCWPGSASAAQGVLDTHAALLTIPGTPARGRRGDRRVARGGRRS